MNNGEIITFDVKKILTYIMPLGSGGTGDTHLFKDETTEMFFAIKKYVPKNKEHTIEYYNRFVDEIKILFNISHHNIVRIYNHYLYPSENTGYLQMEYIDGQCINEYNPYTRGKKDWNDIFAEIISAFEYLEQNNILHRDIRPENILIDKNENVKIIDFGFGKRLDGVKDQKNSIILNWPVTELPDEVELYHEYDKRTEIYFVGYLINKLSLDHMNDFRFHHILEKMIKQKPDERYGSFTEVKNDLVRGVFAEIVFSDKDKESYLIFADDLTNHIISYTNVYSPINDITLTNLKLAELIRSSSLETFIQNNSHLISCFIEGNYKYMTRKDIEVQTIIDFYRLVISLSPTKQKIVFENINNRLATIQVKIDDEELPF